MKNLFFIVASFIIVGGCANPENSNSNTKKKSATESSPRLSENKSIPEKKNKSNFNVGPDFFALVKNVATAYQGFLQGVSKNDSSGPYIFKEYYSDTLSFQLIFFPKNMDKGSVSFDSIKKAEANNYQDYICFAFTYPMQDPDKMKNYHGINIIFPVSVKAFVKKDEDWKLLSESKVYNLTQLSRYEIKCIYSSIGSVK